MSAERGMPGTSDARLRGKGGNPMSEPQITWNDVRRFADELRLELHLAGMDARDRFRALEPRIEELRKVVASAGKHAGGVLDRELASVGAALRRLRADIAKPT
jgi:hypothetical protein